MLSIAITGGIACGKSLVASFLTEQSVSVCETDELAHNVMEKDSNVYNQIVNRFGTDILMPDGRINRKKLGVRVFSDFNELRDLNAIVHPVVKNLWCTWLDDERKRESTEGRAVISAVVIPLLYEIGAHEGWDAVICVWAPLWRQIAFLSQRGLTDSEIRQRLAAQMPTEQKAFRADYVIYNNGTIRLLREQTLRVLLSIQGG